MHLLHTVADLRLYRASLPPSTLGFVPTMGALHAGHAALIRSSLCTNPYTLVSLFLNPLQFAAHEDLSLYPRTHAADLSLCRSLGVHAVFSPPPDAVYPPHFGTYVETACGQAGRNARAEGASRPVFFRGVATVMTKLLVVARARRVYVGQKDAQQCAVVRQLVRDLWVETEVVVVPTVREKNGLAMSSRNAYLTEQQRGKAAVLYLGLQEAKRRWGGGERRVEVLREAVQKVVEEEEGVSVLYVSVCTEDMEEFEGKVEGGCTVCVAAMLGEARLIDNVVLGDAG